MVVATCEVCDNQVDPERNELFECNDCKRFYCGFCFGETVNGQDNDICCNCVNEENFIGGIHE